jgi:hypothetical protein
MRKVPGSLANQFFGALPPGAGIELPQLPPVPWTNNGVTNTGCHNRFGDAKTRRGSSDNGID